MKFEGAFPIGGGVRCHDPRGRASDEWQNSGVNRNDVPMGSASNGRGRIDDSNYGPTETMNRLEAQVKAKGMVLFARIDHAAGATEAGLSLRPTELLIFGNAKAGTPLMQAIQTIGIDLPLKVLVWTDQATHGFPLHAWRPGRRRSDRQTAAGDQPNVNA
jgi:uncharacterized protein (DUF302 family)